MDGLYVSVSLAPFLSPPCSPNSAVQYCPTSIDQPLLPLTSPHPRACVSRLTSTWWVVGKEMNARFEAGRASPPGGLHPILEREPGERAPLLCELKKSRVQEEVKAQGRMVAGLDGGKIFIRQEQVPPGRGKPTLAWQGKQQQQQ